MQKRHRTFIAINLPPDTKKRLVNFEKKYTNVPARWTEIDNLHITVLFFGDLTDEELAEVCRITGEVAKSYNQFNVVLDKVAYGPVGKIPPRYIWAGGETSEELVNLKKDLENALFESVKFKIDKNIFTPHITLARIKEFEWRRIEPEERPEVGEELDSSFTVESIEVMESELKRGGPQYTVVESHQLQ
ncbi:RNA 2',3'-cyclic phosphodiesterase [Candidatus Parcubacteria bacterium]|nr:RNA 2',3'-cyclic phosphodiesterase [Candidatus Parcubacteria bacterium]